MTSRILTTTLALLLSASFVTAEAGGGKSKKKKKAKAAAAQVEKAGRVDPPAAVGTAIQTGTGAVAPTESTVVEPSATPAAETVRVTGKIVYGAAHQARRVAEVDVQAVFASIPAYKKIKTENVPKHKARYHILISRANEEFQTAVQAIALHGTYDLVVEKGGVSGVEPTDITDDVVKRVDP